MDILVKSGRFSKWEDLAFGFHFGAVPPFLLIFHVFIVTVVGGVMGGEDTQAIISRSETLNAVCLSLGHLVTQAIHMCETI